MKLIALISSQKSDKRYQRSLERNEYSKSGGLACADCGEEVDMEEQGSGATAGAAKEDEGAAVACTIEGPAPRAIEGPIPGIGMPWAADGA